jgi:hypothetical protein
MQLEADVNCIVCSAFIVLEVRSFYDGCLHWIVEVERRSILQLLNVHTKVKTFVLAYSVCVCVYKQHMHMCMHTHTHTHTQRVNIYELLCKMWLANNDTVLTASDCDAHHQSTYILITTERFPFHMQNRCPSC